MIVASKVIPLNQRVMVLHAHACHYEGESGEDAYEIYEWITPALAIVSGPDPDMLEGLGYDYLIQPPAGAYGATGWFATPQESQYVADILNGVCHAVACPWPPGDDDNRLYGIMRAVRKGALEIARRKSAAAKAKVAEVTAHAPVTNPQDR